MELEEWVLVVQEIQAVQVVQVVQVAQEEIQAAAARVVVNN